MGGPEGCRAQGVHRQHPRRPAGVRLRGRSGCAAHPLPVPERAQQQRLPGAAGLLPGGRRQPAGREDEGAHHLPVCRRHRLLHRHLHGRRGQEVLRGERGVDAHQLREAQVFRVAPRRSGALLRPRSAAVPLHLPRGAGEGREVPVRPAHGPGRVPRQCARVLPRRAQTCVLQGTGGPPFGAGLGLQRLRDERRRAGDGGVLPGSARVLQRGPGRADVPHRAAHARREVCRGCLGAEGAAGGVLESVGCDRGDAGVGGVFLGAGQRHLLRWGGGLLRNEHVVAVSSRAQRRPHRPSTRPGRVSVVYTASVTTKKEDTHKKCSLLPSTPPPSPQQKTPTHTPVHKSLVLPPSVSISL
eukprot:Rhum_TRINITY_DN9357_c1_g1::Rhum_TRINITY_DN9357_c1_g1_i1::g.33074::m.33074